MSNMTISQRLLKKSRTNHEISQTSPHVSDDHLQNFRVSLQVMSKKVLSDESDVKDPTIYSQRKSRLSQFSQINQRHALDRSSIEFPINEANAKQLMNYSNHLTQQSKQPRLRWRELSGIPKNADVKFIMRLFINKLKAKAKIWEQSYATYPLLQEKYLVQDVVYQVKEFRILKQQLIILCLVATYIIIPLQACLNVIPSVLGLLLLAALQIDSLYQLCQDVIRSSSKFTIIDIIYDNLTITLYCIFGTLLQLVNLDAQNALVLLILTILCQIIYHYHKYQTGLTLLYPTKSVLSIIVAYIVYANLLTSVWIIIQQANNSDSISYLSSLVWVVNNILPLGAIRNNEVTIDIEVEQITSILYQFISLLLQCYIVLSYYQINIAISTQQSEVQGRIEMLKSYLAYNNVSSHVSSEAIGYLHAVNHNNHRQNLNKINKLMKMLPNQLQRTIKISSNGGFLSNVPFFRRYFGQDLLNSLALHSETVQFNPNTIVLHKHSTDDHIYVVMSGQLNLVDENGKQMVAIQKIQKYDIIGLEHLLSNCSHQLTIQTVGFVTMLKISNHMFAQSVNNQQDWETWHYLRYELTFNNRVDLLLQQCSICKSINHLSYKCTSVHLVPDKTSVLAKYTHSVTHHRCKMDRISNFRINSRINSQLVSECGIRYRKNYGIHVSEYEDDDEVPESQLYDDQGEQNVYSYRDLSNPSRLTSSNIDKQKSMEMISGQTLKEFIYHEHEYEEPYDYNRHQMIKQTIQTAGFQPPQEDYLADSGITIPLQHKTITQNSNTYKSSSGQTYQSQKSQQRQQQKVHVTAPPIDKPRPNQNKLTFQYDPHQPELQKAYLNHHQTMDYQMLRPQTRSSTNYVPNQQSQLLPVVSEESSSMINFNPPPVISTQPFASAMSISSVGAPSIDDNLRRDKTGTYSGYRRIRNPSATGTGGISPGKVSVSEKRKSGSGGSFSYLSSNRMHHMSDFEVGQHRHLFKDEIDIDSMHSFRFFKPLFNVDNIVNQFSVKSKVNKRKKAKLK